MNNIINVGHISELGGLEAPSLKFSIWCLAYELNLWRTDRQTNLDTTTTSTTERHPSENICIPLPIT